MTKLWSGIQGQVSIAFFCNGEQRRGRQIQMRLVESAMKHSYGYASGLVAVIPPSAILRPPATVRYKFSGN